MRTILIVDDAPVYRAAVSGTLSRKGYRAMTAADGHEAIALMEHHAPDLILLDLQMPVMDGRTFLEAIRGEPRWKKLPVILITASGESDWMQGFDQLDVRGGLVKSTFSVAELVAKVEEVLQAADDRSNAVPLGTSNPL